MCQRKGLDFAFVRAGVSYVGGIIGCPDYTLTAVISAGDRSLAAFFAVEFDSQTCYMVGGSRADSSGAHWHLQISMLRRAYEKHPNIGKFVMGYVDWAIYGPIDEVPTNSVLPSPDQRPTSIPGPPP